VKLDNLIQIAHNVVIDEHTVIAGQSGVAGSSKVGKYCIIGAQVGMVGHISIANGSIIGGQSGISGTIKEENKKWFGSPAFDYADSIKSSIIFKKLPQLYKTVALLEKKLNEK
jgi:UDP-3-O-[3-hydroxymyristoyl] glucosamine N-acyltransferase